MRLIARFHELVFADRFLAFFRVEIRIFEQSRSENVHEQTISGNFKLFEQLRLILARRVVICRYDRSDGVEAAELIHAGIQQKTRSLGHLVHGKARKAVVVVHSPYHPREVAVETAAGRRFRSDNVPVRRDDAFESIRVTQHAVQHIIAVCIAHVQLRARKVGTVRFAAGRLHVRNRIVGHHGRRHAGAVLQT